MSSDSATDGHETPPEAVLRGPRMKVKVGVMGGASDIAVLEHMEKAHMLGQAVAERGCILITGACPGLPLAAACGAKQAGGLVVGISPALSLVEHVEKYGSPTEFHDLLIFTGSGLMGREVINIRSSDIVVIVGGRSGTLGELAIAYDEGKLIGVLAGMGGISELVPDIVAACAKETGAQVVYDEDPNHLIAELIRILEATKPIRRADERTDTNSQTVEDPVCHMRILPSAAVAERVWEGARYFFCSTSCAQCFDVDPPRYRERAANDA